MGGLTGVGVLPAVLVVSEVQCNPAAREVLVRPNVTVLQVVRGVMVLPGVWFVSGVRDGGLPGVVVVPPYGSYL